MKTPLGFRWLPKIVDKIIGEHGIYPEDVEDALTNDDPEPLLVRKGDVYECYCQTLYTGQYIFVVIVIEEDGTIRPITAYDMPDHKKSKYKKWLGNQK